MSDMMREQGPVRTNLWCHDCRNDFSATFDFDLDGNHVVACPHCGHEHCRVIKAGVVTDVRWSSRNGPTIQVMPLYIFQAATASTSTCQIFLASSWARTTTI